MSIGVLRLYHINVNCRDLDRSLAWYCGVLGLTAATRTSPDRPQPGDAFGLPSVQWDAWILHGTRGQDGLVLDLLQWQEPPPTGRPAGENDTGFVGLVLGHPDPDALGADRGPDDRVHLLDPDGTRITVVPDRDGPRLLALDVGCADRAASRHFYSDLLGFGPEPPAHSHLADPGVEVLTDAATGGSVRLVDRPGGRVRRRAANELGIFRTASFTADIDASYQRLLDAGIHCYSPPATLEMGPGLPRLRALFFDDPDRACAELIEVPNPTPGTGRPVGGPPTDP